MLKSRALELYHEARTRREEQIRLFEADTAELIASTTRSSRTCNASRRGSPRSPLAILRRVKSSRAIYDNRTR
jgi:hypothetical protein